MYKRKKRKEILQSKHKISAYTLVEVLISVTILSALFLVLGQTILTIYKANQYITTLNSVSAEVSIASHVLRKTLISASANAITCNLSNQDMNGDGHTDKRLIEFATYDNKDHYMIVLHQNETVPYSAGGLTYNKLVLYKYDDATHRYQEYVALTNPTVTFTSINVECSAPVEDKLSNTFYTMVTIRGNVDSLEKYMFIPKLTNTEIVKDYPMYQSILISN